MVEHNLAKVGVAGSNPVSRSKAHMLGFFFRLANRRFARVVELVDTQDLKSCVHLDVRVQVPSRVQVNEKVKTKVLAFFLFYYYDNSLRFTKRKYRKVL